MFNKLFLFCFLNWCVINSKATKAPFIKPCTWDDRGCLKTSSQNAFSILAGGVRDLNVPSSEPLSLGDINANYGELNLAFKDLKYVGISKCNVFNLERDIKKSTILLEVECPVAVSGKYVAGGKLLIPVEGDGNINVISNKIKISVTLHMKTIDGPNGEKHWKVASYDHTFEPQDKCSFHLENLFNGDKAKAKHVEEILNVSWKEVMLELGKPVIDKIVLKAVENCNKFFLAVPTEELELLKTE